MPNLFYYHKTSLVHIFFGGGGFGMNKFSKICMLKFSTEQVSNMASANVGLNCMENLNFSDNDYIKEECEMIIIIVSDWV
jgi:hypothetical protein